MQAPSHPVRFNTGKNHLIQVICSLHGPSCITQTSNQLPKQPSVRLLPL
uniref:Uncharacterized protein n=1 Tax=Arundo donax TaxID=35708 RepID=A0A0A9FEN3_ARUDO